MKFMLKGVRGCRIQYEVDNCFEISLDGKWTTCNATLREKGMRHGEMWMHSKIIL